MSQIFFGNFQRRERIVRKYSLTRNVYAANAIPAGVIMVMDIFS